MRIVSKPYSIVFSGAPSSGKTTTADEFRKLGYDVREVEVAREYILEILASLKEQYPNETEVAIQAKLGTFAQTSEFNNEMSRRKLDYERSLTGNKITVIDSSLACGMVYNNIFETNLDPKLNQEIEAYLQSKSYQVIFSFDMLPFHDDGVRYERDQALRDSLHTSFRQQYARLGYQYIVVPVMPVADRVKYMVNILEQTLTPSVIKQGSGTKNFSGAVEFLSPKNSSIRSNNVFYGSFFQPPNSKAIIDNGNVESYTKTI